MKNAMKRMLAMLLVAILMVGFLPSYAFAAPVELPDSMPMVSDKESTLAPGVTLHEIVAYSGDGHRVEIYVTETDLSVDTVEIYANYNNNSLDEFGLQKTTEQAAAFEKNHPGKQVVAAINGSYYNMSNGEPNGAMVMEGVAMDNRSNDPNSRPFFAILNDGTAYIGHAGEYNAMKDQIKEAIGGEFSLIVNGNNVQPKDSQKYPRQTIGITADGRVITMLADGYRFPESDGTTIWEQAEIMKELGCVQAIHLDGGGSATTCAKPEGSDTLEVVSTPGDKFERPVSSTLVIVSSATASDDFHHAALTPENDYVTPGSTVPVKVTGVSATGHNAPLPADAKLQVKDAAMGTIVDGAYVAKEGFVGDAIIQLVSGGTVCGETTIHVVIPTEISFAGEKLVVKYGNTSELEMKATINEGRTPVAIKASDFAFTWADNAALGTIDGFTFTASTDMTLTGPVVLTATLVHNTAVADTMAIALTDLPDKPVIIADFEDKVGYRISSGSPEADWLDKSYGIVDASNGRVHSGEYAFKYALSPNTAGDIPVPQGYWSHGFSMGNPSDSTAYPHSAGQNGHVFLEGKEFASIDLTNAVTFGMWVYLPEDTYQTQIQGYLRNSQDGATYQWMVYQLGYTYSEEGHTGWTYFELNFEELNASQGKTFNDGNWYLERFRISCGARRPDQMNNGAGYDFDYEPAGHQSQTGYVEFYFDDITVEYLDLDVDREDPDFTSISMNVGAGDMEVNGQTITSNKISFAAVATDASALDATSAKAYIDGNPVDVKFNDGTLSVDALTLADGTHNITFVISDEHGNCDYITRQFVVNAGSKIPTVTVKPNANNAADDKLLLGALYWLDVEVDNIENVDTITMKLNLDACSNWELQGMELAYGFSAEYSIDPANNTATITITKTGAAELTGHAVIAQLPVRAWYYQNGKFSPIGNIEFNGGWWSPFDVRVTCDLGLVTYADGNKTTFSSANIDCDTELYDWFYVMQQLNNIPDGKTHVHTPVALPDKAPTCTENGYTGRTFCEGCNSVVDWGTKIAATDHEYALLSDGHVECINDDCDKLLTGFFTGDGKQYINGLAVQGWVGDSYIIDGKPVTGIYAVNDVYYDFGEDGVNKGKVTGLFLNPADHKHSYAVAGVLKTGWIMVDDDWYYFDEKGDAMVGPAVLTDGIEFVFEADGKLHDGVWVTTEAGSRYYYGPAYHKAPGTNFYNKYTMVTIDGNEYCFGVDGYRLEGIQWITKSTDLDQHFWYDFGTDGIARPFGTGFYTIDGGLYYIENGVSTYRGLFEIDGNYYYQRSSHELVVNQNYRITKNNDLLPIDNYDFDKDGKIILPDTTLNGIVEENGELFYYVNGEKTYAGLIKIGEDYYYVNSSCKVVTGSYRITKTNDLLPVDTYEFGEDGKMIREETKKNGIFTEDGVMYYYVDGMKTYAGLIKIGNDYYYVNSSCKVVTGTYRITKTNDLLPVDTYVFGEDGKMVVADTTKEGIIAEDGVLYYYVDGKKNYAGLIKIGEHYYYVNSSCKVVTGMYRITKHNDLLPVDTYEFGADGKMVVADATKEGIVNENGTLYYYVDGKKSYAGLIKIGEDYYYVNSSCMVVTGTYRITKTNDLLPVDTYEFGEDGKMVR